MHGAATTGLPLVVGSGRTGGASTVLLVSAVGLALASVHVLTPGVDALESLPRSPILSFGSGVSVAYVFVHVPEAVLGAFVAFLAGSIVLNALKEELPDERDTRFEAFATGAVLYAGLLLVV